MIISIPKESFKGEKRVALTPESATQIQKLGHTLRIETGAGKAAEFSDADYRDADVEVVSAEEVWTNTDIIMKVRGVTSEEADLLKAGTTVISFFSPTKFSARVPPTCPAPTMIIFMLYSLKASALLLLSF